MSSPTIEHVERLKRLARYLVDKSRVRIQFKYQREVKELVTLTDTDFAGCSRTRKSTSGGCAVMGDSHPIKTWSSTRQSTALSFGESKMVGVTETAAMTLGIRSRLADFGVKCPARVWTDS